jgi:type IV pilus assembly protein PilA
MSRSRFTLVSPVSVPAHRAFTLIEIMIVVVIIGLLVALAIPGFQKVRLASQDKAVLNNARLLAAAADQYMMQQGVTAVTFTALIGSENFVKVLNVVAGENYPVDYTQGVTITINGVAGARTITYGL